MLLIESWPVDPSGFCPRPNKQGGLMSQGTRRYHNPWSCQCPSLGSNSTSWQSWEKLCCWEMFIGWFGLQLKNGTKAWCQIPIFHNESECSLISSDHACEGLSDPLCLSLPNWLSKSLQICSVMASLREWYNSPCNGQAVGLSSWHLASWRWTTWAKGPDAHSCY